MARPIDNQQVKQEALAAARERSGGEAPLGDDELAEYYEENEEYEEEGEDEEAPVEETEPPAKKGFRFGRWDLLFIILGAAVGLGVRGCAR